ncbi:unnamed protein product [Heterobilharzia americana]|nr:unnamed protein product [Heterobilharzia americana]CAH8499973.1 unnamed protein product [Heterobilharzia americana]
MLDVFKNPIFVYYKLFDLTNIAHFAAIAPSPSKDFHHLLITASKIKWRWWKITSRNDGAKYRPGENVATYEEFKHDDRMQGEILRVMGQETLDYCINLCDGKLDYLVRLPYEILAKIISYLNLEDIVNLGITSKFFNQMCNSDSLWREIYTRTTSMQPSDAVEELAKLFGWKKLLFTNKLHLQGVTQQTS